MKRLAFFAAFVMLGLMFSCEMYTIPKADVPTDVSYATDVQPIFDSKCVGCHGGGAIQPNLRPGNSYNALVNGGYVDTDDPESSSIYAKCAEGHGGANQEEAATILGWIIEGAQNN